MAGVIASAIPGWGLLEGFRQHPHRPALRFRLNGVLIAFLKLPPFIVTLGSLTAVRSIARLMGSDTTVFNPRAAAPRLHRQRLALEVIHTWLAVIAFLVVVVSWFPSFAQNGPGRAHLCSRQRQSERGEAIRDQGLGGPLPSIALPGPCEA